MRKRGLVIIYDPHALMQFMQFYCMGDFEAEWDALCLPKENGETDMQPYCEKLGLFGTIYTGNTEYMNLALWDKLKLFVMLGFFSVTGRRKACCKRILNQYVGNVDEYDILASNTENGFISGMTASLGEEKEVVYFEDGAGDYIFYRHKWQSIYKFGSFEAFQCVIMSRLGYCAKGFTYLKPTMNCYKYASVKGEVLYRNYKEIRQFVLDNVAQGKYQKLLERIYPNLESFHIDEDMVVVFTEVIEDAADDYEEYVKQFVDIVCANSKNILLKRHPRERKTYAFPKDVKVTEVPANIAAEIIFPYLRGKRCYLMSANSLLLNMDMYNIEPIIIFSKYINEQIRNNVATYPDRSGMEAMCRRFLNDRYCFVDI